MEPRDEPPRRVDPSASFGSKRGPLSQRKIEQTALVSSRAGSMAQERRLAAHGLRPTSARVGVLSILDKAMPSCLDASRIYSMLCERFDALTLGTVYRALSDLWIAGLLVRTEGVRGRAFYAVKPDALTARHDALRCRCGARMVFIEDLALRERLQALACANGFALDAESVFTITTLCARCRHPGDEAWEATEGVRRARTRIA